MARPISKGFSWKSIEQKPSNWETIRSLIEDGYNPQEESVDRFWNHPLVYETFLKVFPDLKEWIQLDSRESTHVIKPKTKSSGKKMGSKKNEIQTKVEEDMIRKEIQTIRIDTTTLQPIKTKTDMQITFFLTILVWNYVLYKRKKSPLAVRLDAMISFHRMYEKDIHHITRKDIRQSIDSIRNLLNGCVTEEMYTCLFQNPVLLVDSTSQRRTSTKKLYPEQRLILDQIEEAIKENLPLLLGNQMPTGTGKTFLAVPLAKRLSFKKLDKTVLFTCSNELVNRDVACTALLADDLHVWLAKLVRPEFETEPTVLLRPYKRCFPSTWKRVYKQTDSSKIGSIQDQWNFYVHATKKNPDIIVADLDASLEILRQASTIGNPFLAYIDEFVSDESSNRIVAEMCQYLPRQTVLLSSILPQFEDLPNVVSYFCQKHGTCKEKSLLRVATADVNISCAIIDSDGRLRLPHHQATLLSDIEALHGEILKNPRIRRCYPAKHVYYWAKSVESLLSKEGMTFGERFRDLGGITNAKVVDYAIDLIALMCRRPEWLEAFQSYRPKITEPPCLEKMFTDHAYMYEGKTLVITDNVLHTINQVTKDLVTPPIRYADIVRESKKLASIQELRIQRLERAKMNKLEKERMYSQIQDDIHRASLPPFYVINSREHVTRFHPNESSLLSRYRIAIDLPENYEEAFSDEMNVLLASGIGLYDRQQMTEYQRDLVMNLYDKLAFLCSGKDVVFGTNLAGLTNIFIDVSFARQQSIPTLYQLMGRVGRMGRSYHASIFLNHEDSVQKILSLETNMDKTTVTWMDTLFISFLCSQKRL